MTREEAIKWLTNEKWKNANNQYKKDWNEAFSLAIEALQTDLVRCKDCRWYSKGENDSDSWALCTVHTGQYISVDDNEFCSYGERREP